MTKRATLYRELLREYDRTRQREDRKLKERQKRIYTALPRVEEIELAIAKTGIGMAKIVLQEPEKALELSMVIQEEIYGLQQEKNRLLLEAGFTSEDLQMGYHCQVCQDTGYVGQEPCACFRQRLMEMAYEKSNIQERVAEENFHTFDLRYYSEKSFGDEVDSPRLNMQNIFRTAVDFCDQFGQTFANLFLYGSTGLGKTFLLNCIAKEILEKGHTVLYFTAAQLFQLIEERQFHKKGSDEDQEDENYLEDILETDLFIIDDLGSEFSTILTSAQLFHILNTRMLQKKPVILSTNLAMSELVDQYSDRVVSRILGEYHILHFYGEDIRWLKKRKRG